MRDARQTVDPLSKRWMGYGVLFMAAALFYLLYAPYPGWWSYVMAAWFSVFAVVSLGIGWTTRHEKRDDDA